MTPLNDSNFTLYAAANYTNTCYDTEEFYDDIKRFKYLKRLFSRYQDNDDLKERLILNHLITLYNVFNGDAVTRMLFYKTDERHWRILKTFLLYMQRMPKVIYHLEFHNNHVKADMIGVDLNIADTLRKI